MGRRAAHGHQLIRPIHLGYLLETQERQLAEAIIAAYDLDFP